MLTKPDDLSLLGRRTEVTRTLHGHWQSRITNHTNACSAVHAPVHERIPVGEEVFVEPRFSGWFPIVLVWLGPCPGKAVLLANVQTNSLDHSCVRASLFAGVEANRSHHTLAAFNQLGGRKA